MTKEKLFKKYSINESHNVWDNSIDNWWSVEVYRLMKGYLPKDGDNSFKYLLDFMDNSINYFGKDGFGSMYLTAKRMIYRFSNEIILELQTQIK